MADEQINEEGPAEEAAVQETPAAVPAAPGDGSGLKWLSFLFVALAAVGVFSFGTDAPSPGVLGVGLLGWGIVDLFGQKKGLGGWSGPQAGSNLLNLSRSFFLLGMGVLLMLQAFGVMDVFGSNTLLVAGVSFLAGYLLGAYALELATKSGDSFSHAILMAGFFSQFVSFFCFAFLFSVAWAAVFGFLSLAMSGWAIYRGVLKQAPAIAPNVALVSLLIGLPFGYFLVREVINKDLQPVYQASIFVPRFHELKNGLSRQATDLAWAPGNTQPGSLGDIPYSDKIAFVDQHDGKDFLTVYASHDEGGASTEMPVSASHGRHWWSPNSDKLAFSDVDAKNKRVLLAMSLDKNVIESGGERFFSYKPETVSSQDVVAPDTHGQIFSPDGKNLYYAAPQGKPRRGVTQVWAAQMDKKKAMPLTEPPYKSYPAASPDASKLLYVAFKENVQYIELGDGVEGRNPRYFNYKVESQLFPAWSGKQTHVLYTDSAGALKIMSANNKADAADFSRARLNSRLWKTEKGEFFTLEAKETGDLWQIWTVRPGGGGRQLVYESNATEIFPPQWSADSSRIAFVERSDKRYSIYTVGRDGAWPRRVFVSSDPIRSLSWSPDSARLAWFSDRQQGKHQELWVAEKQSLNPELGYASDAALDSLSWSPSGEHIAFEEKWAFKIGGLRIVRPDLFSTKVLDISDHQARSLTAGGLFARKPAFSPQGVMLAFLTEQRSFPAIPGNWSLRPAPSRPASLAVAQLY